MPKKGFDENLEKVLCSQIVTDEYSVAKANQAEDTMDFEAVLDLLDSRRTDKEYEWMSDIRIPEFTTHVLTQASLDVAAYFRTRDFVEVYVEDDSAEAIASAEAAKELLNRTLNQQHLNYYLKFVRARMLNQLQGKVYAECWWNQETKEQVYGIQEDVVESEVDIHGNPITDRSIQVPGIEIQQTELTEEIPVIDRFEFDILDPRNVFTDNAYTYTLQDKDWVIIRSEKTLEDLKRDADRCGYFNLDAIEKVKAGQGDTETRRETYNAEDNFNRVSPKIYRYLDVLKRYGKFWCKVIERDEETEAPTKVKPGIDVNGDILDKAELVECIITVAMDAGSKFLIGFQPTPYINGDGVPYRPIIRGMCYPHPVEDGGFGDGKHSRELQIAIDDTFNISHGPNQAGHHPDLPGAPIQHGGQRLPLLRAGASHDGERDGGRAGVQDHRQHPGCFDPGANPWVTRCSNSPASTRPLWGDFLRRHPPRQPQSPGPSPEPTCALTSKHSRWRTPLT